MRANNVSRQEAIMKRLRSHRLRGKCSYLVISIVAGILLLYVSYSTGLSPRSRGTLVKDKETKHHNENDIRNMAIDEVAINESSKPKTSTVKMQSEEYVKEESSKPKASTVKVQSEEVVK